MSRYGPLLAASSLLTIVALVSSAPAHNSAPPADQCDWTGSSGGGRGVRPVHLRCSRGTVSWHYPRGALQVVLSGDDTKRGFRGCIKVSGPARVYLEGKTNLRLIYSPRDGKHMALHRCFYSRGRQAALYVEADKPIPSVGELVKLQYDLERHSDLRSGNELDDEAECRPCSQEELAKAYCQSDLVARGTISAVEDRPDLESAELVLRITKTLRRVEESEDNEIDSGDPRSAEIRVRVPTVCDARHGHGEFVIMAKRRLGDLTMACAPRLETWAEAVRELASPPCVLRS